MFLYLTAASGYSLFAYGEEKGPVFTVSLFFITCIVGFPIHHTITEYRTGALIFSALKVVGCFYLVYFWFQNDMTFLLVLMVIFGVASLLEFIGRCHKYYHRRGRKPK